MTGVVAVLTLLALLAAPLPAEDWPQWRGPNRDCVWGETGIMESFPAGGLKISWRAPVGWGWSSPVIAQGRVFVTDAHVMRPTVKESRLLEPTYPFGGRKVAWTPPAFAARERVQNLRDDLGRDHR